MIDPEGHLDLKLIPSRQQETQIIELLVEIVADCKVIGGSVMILSEVSSIA